MGSNLPPGVTPADIDRHFGEPEKREVAVDLSIGVALETQFWDDEGELMKEAMEKIESGEYDVLEIDHVETL